MLVYIAKVFIICLGLSNFFDYIYANVCAMFTW